jgi:hypothetical protein
VYGGADKSTETKCFVKKRGKVCLSFVQFIASYVWHHVSFQWKESERSGVDGAWAKYFCGRGRSLKTFT